MTWTAKEGMTDKQIEKELQKQSVLFEQSCSRGQITAAVKFETLAEEWLENHAKLNLRHATYSRYLQLRPRIYPALGYCRIDKLNTRQIQKFITDLAVNGKNKRTGEPLKRKSLQHHLIFISSVFRYAIRLGMLTDNPCERVILPNEEKPEKEIYTLAEVETPIGRNKTAVANVRIFGGVHRIPQGRIARLGVQGLRLGKQRHQRPQNVQLYRPQRHLYRYDQNKKIATLVAVTSAHYGNAERLQSIARRGA